VPGNSSSSSSCKSWARGVERESVKLPESGGRFQSVALSILNGHIVDSVCLCAVFVYSTTGMRAEMVGISANFLITILEMIREWGMEIKSRTSETLWRQPMTPPTRLFERGLNSSQNVL
jgi:hypothetical protein